MWLDDELPSVNVDEPALVEVIYVLVDNAAKYSAPGSVIKVVSQAADDNKVRLMVEDQGPGIPVELRERVFDRFFRAMRDGDQGKHGTGMGLAIAKGIVEAHDGRIWTEAGESGAGTRFIVELPARKQSPAVPEKKLSRV